MEPTRFGRYELVERITTGGMAEVYRAVASGPGGFQRVVALKKILPAYADSPEFHRMFLDEATIAACLNHANVAQVFDFDIVDGTPFLAMEFVEGKDLWAILQKCAREDRSIPYPIAAYVALETAKGLYYVHTRREASRPLNIIHRDVSPQNIMVSHVGEVKIVDFGIARAVDRHAHTRAGVVKGKYAYMSPEQVLGQPLDFRTDIFSLGTVLWEMLTQRRLFGAGAEGETISNLLNLEIVPPHEHNPSVPEPLSELVCKALERDRKMRYASMLGFCEALSRFLFDTGTHPEVDSLSTFIHDLFPEEMDQLAQGEHLGRARGESFTRGDRSGSVAPPPDLDKTRRAGPLSIEDNREAPPSRTWRGAVLLCLLVLALSGFAWLLATRLSDDREKAGKPLLSAGIGDARIHSGGEALDLADVAKPGPSPLPSALVGLLPESTPDATLLVQPGNGWTPPSSFPAGTAERLDREVSSEPIGRADQDVGNRGTDTSSTSEPTDSSLPGEPDGTATGRDPEESVPNIDSAGHLVVMVLETVPPDAVLRVNGTRVEPGAVEVEAPENDAVTIEARKGGYLPFRTEIPAKHGLRRTFVLTEKSSLLIRVKPHDAKVLVNGKKPDGGHGGVYSFEGEKGTVVDLSAERDGYEYHALEVALIDPVNEQEVTLTPRVKRALDWSKEYGTLVANARPYAQAFINGSTWGQTPASKEVKAGTYTVLLEHLGQTHECLLDIKPGESARCFKDFTNAGVK